MGNCGSSKVKAVYVPPAHAESVKTQQREVQEVQTSHAAVTAPVPSQAATGGDSQLQPSLPHDVDPQVEIPSSVTTVNNPPREDVASTGEVNNNVSEILAAEKICASPMPLLQLLPDSSTGKPKWHLFADTLDLLASIKENIAVISVVGQYRTGKSYLMNRFMGQPNGFEIGHQVVGKTRGIWVWGRKVPSSVQGEAQYVLLLDSEGLGDALRTGGASGDSTLFSMLIMLSSVMIYNTLSAITEDQIEKLS
eukprot:GILJ01011840.1.p1 GENE.GILJ01011840.1~~GILJ01011840.1.p1  ORF type:complete len:251 (+),score=37.02 GILJ01011840.1:133-885(+)